MQLKQEEIIKLLYSVASTSAGICLLFGLHIFMYSFLFYYYGRIQGHQAASRVSIASLGSKILVKILGASYLVSFIKIHFLKVAVSIAILYNSYFSLMFIVHNFFDLDKMMPICKMFNLSFFRLIYFYFRKILAHHLIHFTTIIFYVLTDDSIFFVEGCEDSSILAIIM